MRRPRCVKSSPVLTIDREVFRRQHAHEAEGELGATDAAGEADDLHDDA